MELSRAFRLPPDGRVRIAFFDADWTLRTSRSGATTAVTPDDEILLPFVAEHLKPLTERGYLIAVISNQGWVPSRISPESAEGALAHLAEMLEAQGVKVDYFDFAEDGSHKEKPTDGMAKGLVDALTSRFGSGYTVDWDHSFMIGDAAYEGPKRHKGPILFPEPGTRAPNFSSSDKKFAEGLGISFTEATDYFGWRRYGVDFFANSDEVDAFRRRFGCRDALTRLVAPSLP
jgi:DNA 3'-phosphatase